MNTLNSWSFSKLMVFEECPYRAKLQWIDKIPDLMPRPAADRGTEIHAQAESYIREGGELPEALRHFADEFKALRSHYSEGCVACEEEWGFTRKWQPESWKNAWLRLKCDIVYHLSKTHAAIIDIKTGKRFGSEIKHAQQLQLYALCTLLRYPYIQKTSCELWYVDKNEIASFVMTRAQIQKYLRIYDRRGRALTEETAFEAKPGVTACQWCPYAPARQGNCKARVQGAAPSIPIIPAKRATKTDKLFKNEDLTRYL